VFHVIETLNATTKRSVAYFNDKEEAIEWINQKKKEYKSKGYSIHLVKKNYSRAKSRKSRNNIFHLGMRHYKEKAKYISWSVVRLSEDERINKNLADTEIFGDLFGEKRNKQIALRLSELELKLLNELANKKRTLPANILRTALKETFEKELNKIYKKLITTKK